MVTYLLELTGSDCVITRYSLPPCAFITKHLLRLQALAVLAGRLAEVLGAVAAEVRERGEIHQFGYLGERQTLVTQIVF